MNKHFKTLIKIFIIILLAIIQITLMPYLSILDLWPNIIFILAVVLVLIGAEQEAFLTASLGGLILDLASSLFFGFYTIIFLAIIVIIKFLVNKFLSEINSFVMSAFAVATIFIFNLLFALISHQFSLLPLIINVSYSLIISLIMFNILKIWVHK